MYTGRGIAAMRALISHFLFVSVSSHAPALCPACAWFGVTALILVKLLHASWLRLESHLRHKQPSPLSLSFATTLTNPILLVPRSRHNTSGSQSNPEIPDMTSLLQSILDQQAAASAR